MYHDMRMGSSDELASHFNASAEVAELLQRYPNLGEVELARLIHLYRELSALEAALLSTDTSLTEQLESFVADHQQALRPPLRQYAVLLLFAVLAGILMMAMVAFGS